MPKAYSKDLRERVVKAVEAGQSCTAMFLRAPRMAGFARRFIHIG